MDERVHKDSTPKKKDVAGRCYYGHLILPGRGGCQVPGCKDAADSIKDQPSIVTEVQPEKK